MRRRVEGSLLRRRSVRVRPRAGGAPSTTAASSQHDDDEAGEERVDGVLPEPAAPRREVEAPCGGEISGHAGGELGDRLDGAHHAQLARRGGRAGTPAATASCREQRSRRRRASRCGRDAPTSPRTRAIAMTATMIGAEHDEVARRVRHRRHPDGQPHGVAPARVHEDAVGREEGERQSPGVDALDVREARQRVGVEREHRSGEHPGGAVAGPLERHRVAGPGGQREPENQQDVVDEHRRGPEPVQRGAHERRDDQRLGEGERVARRIEDVAVEEVRGRARQLVRDPRQDPLVQLRRRRCSLRESVAGIARERPGVDDGQQQAEAGDRSRSGAQPRHTDRGIMTPIGAYDRLSPEV